MASFACCFFASEACGSVVYEGGGAEPESNCEDAFVDGGQVYSYDGAVVAGIPPTKLLIVFFTSGGNVIVCGRGVLAAEEERIRSLQLGGGASASSEVTADDADGGTN